jgi:site-specific DNA recombinase
MRKGSIPIVKIGIYLRKSRAEDGTQDLVKHKNYLIEVANRNNWSYELYEEIDSSQALDRAELQRLRHDVSSGRIDSVMVHAVDRLSRKSRHFLEIIEDYFLDQNMNSLYVKDTEHDLTDTTTITMLQLQATLSQAEYSFIVARLNEGRKQSVKEGIVTGKVVYGYYFDKASRKILLQPDESPVVRKIADLLLEGETYKGICDKLNMLGHRTRKGNLWDIHNIKSIAHSPIIRGHVIQQWKDETIEVKDSHESIITDVEYEKMKQILDNRAENYKSLSTAPKHYLQGLLKCPNCERVMTIAGSKPSTYVNGKREYTGEYVYYIRTCRPYIKGKERCGNQGCQATLVEERISKLIHIHKQTLDDSMQKLLEMNKVDIKQSKKETVQDIKRYITTLENKEAGLLDLLLDQTISKEIYNNKINEIKSEKASLRIQLNEAEKQYSALNIEQEIKHQQSIRDTLDDWESLPNAKKRSTLQILFRDILYSRFDKDQSPRLDGVSY